MTRATKTRLAPLIESMPVESVRCRTNQLDNTASPEPRLAPTADPRSRSKRGWRLSEDLYECPTGIVDRRWDTHRMPLMQTHERWVSRWG